MAEPYTADLSEIAKNFGLPSWKVNEADDLRPALEQALASGGPALVEVTTARDAAGPFVTGWWDFLARVLRKEQAEYQAGRAL